MQVSVIVPVYNEERTVIVLLKRVLAAGMDLKEIVVIDDGSKDSTREKVAELAATDPRVRLLPQRQNCGKGAALRAGFAAATGDIVVVQDADLEYDPAELPRLLQPIHDGTADVVFGSRFIGAGAHRVHLFWHMVGNQSADPAFQYVHQFKPHRHGVLLQGASSGKSSRASNWRRTGSALSRK